MHAFLFIDGKGEDLRKEIDALAEKLSAKTLNYPLAKIEDVRNLNNLVRLSFDTPTLIVSENINEAGEEALNAFLKNLEEPQDNVYFALTAPSIRKVIPTIVSRCEIIKVINITEELKDADEIEKFLEMNTGDKLNYIDKIKDRNKAIELVENAITFMHRILHSHSKLHSDRVKYSVLANNLKGATKTLSGLKANGNVNLQMVNFVVNFQNEK